MPTLNGGIGLVSDFKGVDVGGFKHGTTFAVSYGLGMRYVPTASRLSFRADIGSYMNSLEYPISYYTPAGDGTSVLTQATKRSQWRNNWTVTVGLSYQLFR
jgi:long-subunit fatty acid transport protein